MLLNRVTEAWLNTPKGSQNYSPMPLSFFSKTSSSHQSQNTCRICIRKNFLSAPARGSYSVWSPSAFPNWFFNVVISTISTDMKRKDSDTAYTQNYFIWKSPNAFNQFLGSFQSLGYSPSVKLWLPCSHVIDYDHEIYPCRTYGYTNSPVSCAPINIHVHETPQHTTTILMTKGYRLTLCVQFPNCQDVPKKALKKIKSKTDCVLWLSNNKWIFRGLRFTV